MADPDALGLVVFVCPKHGDILRTYPTAEVECRCGEECAPRGETPAEHRKKVATRKRVARHRKSVTGGSRNRRSES